MTRDVDSDESSESKDSSINEELSDPEGSVSITQSHNIPESDVFGLPPAWAEVCYQKPLALNIAC